MRSLFVLAALPACGRLGFGESGADAGVPVVDVAPACPAFAELCDGFEGQPDPSWSRAAPAGTSLAVDTAIPAHTGTQVLDGVVSPGLPGSAAELFRTFPTTVTTGLLATRVWVYPPVAFGSYDGVIRFDRAPQTQYALVASDEFGNWAVSENSPAAGITDHHGLLPATTNAWTCVELDYDLDGHRIRLYIGDAVALDEASDNPAPAFDAVAVGLTRSDGNGWHIYTDDAVIARQHIGC